MSGYVSANQAGGQVGWSRRSQLVTRSLRSVLQPPCLRTHAYQP